MTSCLPGAFNARDVGGLPLVGGGVTRAGVLLRSDALSTLTDQGLDGLAGTGTVIDLRTARERNEAPNRLPPSGAIRVLERPLLEGAVARLAPQMGAAGDRQDEQVPPAAPATPSEEMLTAIRAQIPTFAELYEGMLDHGAAAFADCARAIASPADPRRGGVLIHCTAGKDRTGVAVALLLDTAGVERAAIIADYTRSQDELAGDWSERMLARMRRAGVPTLPEIEQLAVSTPESAIESALSSVDARGGAAAYLRAGGLSDDELALLRSRLREGPVG